MSTKTRIKIGTLRDDAMLFWGMVKMLVFIFFAVLFVGFWVITISTLAIWMISVAQGFVLTSGTTTLLSNFTGHLSRVMSLLAIFTLMPLIIARGLLFLPREEVLDQIHFESLKPSPAYDFSEEGTPDDDNDGDGPQLVRARAIR